MGQERAIRRRFPLRRALMKTLSAALLLGFALSGGGGGLAGLEWEAGAPVLAQARSTAKTGPAGSLPPIAPPADLKALLTRGEELFRANSFGEALVFYYEALTLARAPDVRGKLHFRLGECLEGVRRFEFATYHYQQALRARLPQDLASRVALKLQHLPQLAQREEAMRLFNRAMAAYRKRDIRGCIDDYLTSLQLEPSLMAQPDAGLIDDAIQYLTYLTEAREREPLRLLRLATFLELRGETEKAIEALKQIAIIYPDSPVTREAEEKIAFYQQKRNSYIEVRTPRNALKEAVPPPSPLIFEIDLEFTDPGVVSRDLPLAAFTVKAANEQPNVPERRFESLTVILGRGSMQKEFLFTAEEGIGEKTLTYDDGSLIYDVRFGEVAVTTSYIQDIYGEGVRTAPLFSRVRLHLEIRRPS
jgi:tetratricopeptide (TPR) repeat protein